MRLLGAHRYSTTTKSASINLPKIEHGFVRVSTIEILSMATHVPHALPQTCQSFKRLSPALAPAACASSMNIVYLPPASPTSPNLCDSSHFNSLSRHPMPSSKGKPTDPKLRDQVKEKVKNETNKDGSGKGQWTAWKAQKLSKEYEAKGGDYENEAGSKNEPEKGAPQPKAKPKRDKEMKETKATKKTEEAPPKETPKADEVAPAAEEKATETVAEAPAKEAKEPKKKAEPKPKAAPKKKKEVKAPAEGTRKSTRTSIKRVAPQEEDDEDDAPKKKKATPKPKAAKK